MLLVTIAGRIVRDGTLRYTSEGKPVLGFTVVTDVGFGDNRHGVYVNCSLWGKRAESLDPYIKKGTQVTVTGNGDLRKWQTEQSSGSEITCQVQELSLQGTSSDKNQGPPEEPKKTWDHQGPPVDSSFDDDDIPF